MEIGTIKGTIKDVKTGEYIVNATIYYKSYRAGSVFSGADGRFTLPPPKSKSAKANENPNSKLTLVITSAGYSPYRKQISSTTNITKNFVINLNKRSSKRSDEDWELVQQAIKGNQLAYGKLMERYRDSIYFFIQKMVNNRLDADDLTMEAFGKAFSRLDKYSPDYAFSTWLYRIAVNNAIDFIRKKRLKTLSIDKPLDDDEGNLNPREIHDHGLDPEEKYMKQQRILLARKVIERLNPKYQRLIDLRYIQELSYDEIAKKTELPLGTVKAQLFRARELLHSILKDVKHHY